jgi:uncharacterized beta-barrel protein YwiB (DUF1934 family)
MKMLSLFFGIALVASCSMARLENYPGVKQDSIPIIFQGNYYLKLKSASTDPADSVWIGVSARSWEYVENGKRVAYQLSGDNVFSRVDKYYVLNMRDETIRNYWNSWVLVPRKKDIELYPVITVMKPHSDKLGMYLDRKFGGMNKTDSVFYYEMNNEQFVRYFEKVIKGSKTFTIQRIKHQKK